MLLQTTAGAIAVFVIGGAAAAAFRSFLLPEPPPAATPAPVVAAAPPAAAPKRPAPPPAQEEQLKPSDRPPEVAARRARTRVANRDLLKRANSLRAARRWREAERAYLSVAQAGNSPEGYTATVAAAALALEQGGRPKVALRRYRVALRMRPGGSLSEEVRLGIADAQQALGDAEAEAEALQSFLRAHPKSLMRRTAKQRLKRLEAMLPRVAPFE